MHFDNEEVGINKLIIPFYFDYCHKLYDLKTKNCLKILKSSIFSLFVKFEFQREVKANRQFHMFPLLKYLI